MINYMDMFAAIVRALREDYAGYQDKKSLDKANVYSGILAQAYYKHDLDDAYFVRTVNEYLAEFMDRNLRFDAGNTDTYTRFSNGFRVRRYADKLYVCQAGTENRLQVGDCIIRLNRADISSLVEKPNPWLYGDTPERELWTGIIKMGWSCTVLHKDGRTEEINLKRYPVEPPDGQMQYRALDSTTLYLGLKHFYDAEAVRTLLHAHDDELRRAKKLIIDVRKNTGGADNAYLPLFEYIYHEPIPLVKLIDDKGLYTNYSKENCRHRAALYASYLEQADEHTRELINGLIKEIQSKEGKGFLFEKDEDLQEIDYTICGGDMPEKIVVLTDTYCENGGEEFVRLCKKSKKATVIGRPTMGNLDYTNLVTVSLNDTYRLIYPMSKSPDAWAGNGINRKGVEVDTYIPWTPGHLEKDVDMEMAMAL